MSTDAPEGFFEEFVREYGERAFQFAYRLTGNVEESKDLVQDAFYRTLRSWDRYDPSRPLNGWYFTILRHLFLDGRKRYERRHKVSLDERVQRTERGADAQPGAMYADLLPVEEETVLESLERRESADLVRRTLDALSDQLLALAETQPVLMVFEDLHWVDPTTQEAPRPKAAC